MYLSCAIPSTSLHKFDWAQGAWINQLSASLNFFAWALVTGPPETWIGSEYASSYVFVIVLSSISSGCPFALKKRSWTLMISY